MGQGARSPLDRVSDVPALVCFPFVGRGVGGSHISALGLIRSIDPARYVPLVLIQDAQSELGELISRAGIPFEIAPKTVATGRHRRLGLGQLVAMASRARTLARFLRERGIRIVHTNDGNTHAAWGLAARLAGARLIWHHRSSPSAYGLRFAAPFLADRVVSVSRFAAPRPGLVSAAGKTRVIHSPFDTAVEVDRVAARARLVAELGCPPETHLIGYFGTLIARKRPLLFVDAVAALERALPGQPAMGLLFGEAFDGAETRVPERAAALGASDRIRMMGFRYPGVDWLGACDLLLVPAVDEPFGRTLIEAMLVGTPVVATASGGNPEAIRHGETGMLAPPEDAEALASAMAAVLGDKARWSRIAAAARADALSRFGEDRHAADVMALYDEVLKPAGAARLQEVAS